MADHQGETKQMLLVKEESELKYEFVSQPEEKATLSCPCDAFQIRPSRLRILAFRILLNAHRLAEFMDARWFVHAGLRPARLFLNTLRLAFGTY